MVSMLNNSTSYLCLWVTWTIMSGISTCLKDFKYGCVLEFWNVNFLLKSVTPTSKDFQYFGIVEILTKHVFGKNILACLKQAYAAVPAQPSKSTQISCYPSAHIMLLAGMLQHTWCVKLHLRSPAAECKPKACLRLVCITFGAGEGRGKNVTETRPCIKKKSKLPIAL